MKLKKQSDILYAIIKRQPVSELKQFKRFINFEHQKPKQYLSFLDQIIKLVADWDINENFPEDKLKQKCSDDVIKKFTIYKFKLKKSIFNFNQYLVVSTDHDKDFRRMAYFLQEMTLSFSVYARFGFFDFFYNRIDFLAEQAFDDGKFALSNNLYNSMYYFIDLVFPAYKETLQEERRIKKKIDLIYQKMADFNETIFYQRLLFNASENDAKDLIQNEIENFQLLNEGLSSDVANINRSLAETHLSNLLKDDNAHISANEKIINFLDKNPDVSNLLKRHNFTARINAFHSALHIDDEKLAIKLLEDSNTFLQKKMLPFNLTEEFYFHYLNGKITYNNYYEKDAAIMLSDVNKLKETIENAVSKHYLGISLTSNYIYAYYISEHFDLAYETSNSNYKTENYSAIVLICHILSQYHIFDFDFLTYSYRSISRNLSTNETYSEQEIATIKKILNLLLKLKSKKDIALKNEIATLILLLKDGFYKKIQERIADVFIKNA